MCGCIWCRYAPLAFFFFFQAACQNPISNLRADVKNIKTASDEMSSAQHPAGTVMTLCQLWVSAICQCYISVIRPVLNKPCWDALFGNSICGTHRETHTWAGWSSPQGQLCLGQPWTQEAAEIIHKKSSFLKKSFLLFLSSFLTFRHSETFRKVQMKNTTWTH